MFRQAHDTIGVAFSQKPCYECTIYIKKLFEIFSIAFLSITVCYISGPMKKICQEKNNFFLTKQLIDQTLPIFHRYGVSFQKVFFFFKCLHQ